MCRQVRNGGIWWGYIMGLRNGGAVFGGTHMQGSCREAKIEHTLNKIINLFLSANINQNFDLLVNNVIYTQYNNNIDSNMVTPASIRKQREFKRNRSG